MILCKFFLFVFEVVNCRVVSVNSLLNRINGYLQIDNLFVGVAKPFLRRLIQNVVRKRKKSAGMYRRNQKITIFVALNMRMCARYHA